VGKKINLIEDEGKGLKINEQWTGEEKEKQEENDNNEEDVEN